tara:strand:- start:256 stop:864 length:609 start_codon:yes stop_codon:yes gene_type:complete
MAFGSPDNCRLSDLGLIAAGSGSSTSGSATSQKKLRADCANSSSATNVRLWGSFSSPDQSQMMSGTVLDDDPEDYTYEVDTNDSSVGGSVTTDSPSTYGIGTYFMSRCWNLNTTFIQNTWEAVIATGSIFGSGTTTNETAVTTDWSMSLQGNNTGTGSVYIRQTLDGSSAWKKFFGLDSGTDWMGRVTANVNRTSSGGGGGE